MKRLNSQGATGAVVFFEDKDVWQKAGVVKCPMTWVYWTSPYSSHKKDHIPIMESNGWVMFNGDI